MNISSIAASSNAAYVPQAGRDNYGLNTDTVLPVIDAATGATPGTASAIFSFSAESLARLSDAVGSALTGTGDAIESAADTVKEEISSLGSGLSDLAHEGMDAISHAGSAISDAAHELVQNVEDFASDTGTAIGDAVSSVEEGIGSALSGVGAYLALGVSAGKELLNEIA